MLVGECPQRLPADELGDEIARLRLRTGEVVDVEDVRVMQARNGVRLAIEALADLLSRMEVGVQHLHGDGAPELGDRKSTRLNSSHGYISYAVFCLKKKKKKY